MPVVTDARKQTVRLIVQRTWGQAWRKYSAAHDADSVVYIACEPDTPMSEIVHHPPHTSILSMRDGERLFMAWVADPEWLNQFATVGEAMSTIDADESKTSWRYRPSGCEVT